MHKTMCVSMLMILCLAKTIQAIEFLHRVLDIFQDYFGELEETSIKDNFATIYQLLEEMVDNGTTLTTEPNTLKAMISPPKMINLIAAAAPGKSSRRQ